MPGPIPRRPSSSQARRSSRRFVGHPLGTRVKPSGNFSLKAGVLAAGRGERLRTESGELKSLEKVEEETLIERVLNSMSEAGATEVTVIINEDSRAVREHVTKREWPFALSWIIETTTTSMHSFLRL